MKENLGKWFVCVVGVLWGLGLSAQPANDDCSNAIALCSNTATSGSTVGGTTELGANAADGPATTGTFCFETNNTVWFSFTTNGAGGNVSIAIDQFNCSAAAGASNELSAVIVEATTPCDATTYTPVSACVDNAVAPINLNGPALAPNTTYYVVVDGAVSAGATSAGACDFTITASGPALTITATSTVMPQNCGTVDGTISIDNVDGGTAPYSYSLNGGASQASNQFNLLAAGSYYVTITDAGGCMHTVSGLNIAEVGGPTTAAITTTAATCTGADGQIDVTSVTGGTAPYMYSINGGAPQASATFPNLGAGNYTVTVFDVTGCSYTANGVMVQNNGGILDASFVSTDGICGQPDGTITVSVNVGGAAPFMSSLNGGIPQMGNGFTNLAAGNYTVTITDNAGCTFTLYNIIINDPAATLTPTIAISAAPNPGCQGDPITFTAVVNNGGSSGTIDWMVNNTSVQNSAATTYSSAINNGDVVTAVFSSPDPCLTSSSVQSNSLTMTVLPVTNPTISITASTTNACVGDAVTFGAVATDCGPGAIYTFSVNGGAAQAGLNDTFTTTNLLNGDQVTVTVECNYPCANPSNVTSSTVTMNVTVPLADAGPNHTIVSGNSVVLEGSGNGITVLWVPSTGLDDPTSLTPTASPTETTTYFLTVTDGNCSVTDEVTVLVIQPLNPPNMFTPNDDGINDTWRIPSIERFPNVQVLIYTRWGQQIFDSTGYASPWDGTNNGSTLPVGIYYYIIKLDRSDDEAGLVSGSITIAR